MRFFLLRRRQCLKVDMAEEEKEKYREKLPKIEGLVCGHTLKQLLEFLFAECFDVKFAGFIEFRARIFPY